MRRYNGQAVVQKGWRCGRMTVHSFQSFHQGSPADHIPTVMIRTAQSLNSGAQPGSSNDQRPNFSSVTTPQSPSSTFKTPDPYSKHSILAKTFLSLPLVPPSGTVVSSKLISSTSPLLPLTSSHTLTAPSPPILEPLKILPKLCPGTPPRHLRRWPAARILCAILFPEEEKIIG